MRIENREIEVILMEEKKRKRRKYRKRKRKKEKTTTARPQVYRVTRQELKKILLDYLVDKDGKKVPKRKLCKNAEFLDKIGCEVEEVSNSTISNWCLRLKNIEPYGEITEEFLFEYHKNVTKRIPQYLPFSKFSKALAYTVTGWKIKNLNGINWDDWRAYFTILHSINQDSKEKSFRRYSAEQIRELLEVYFTEDEILYFKAELDELAKQGKYDLIDVWYPVKESVIDG